METATPVADEALAIPELLETILLSVPEKDLLIAAQLVSREWRNAIRASRKLQRRLFLLLERETSFIPTYALENIKHADGSVQQVENYGLIRHNPLCFDT